ncbi:CHAT domain-containing protein [Paraburkholderia sp. J63]|uniref:CHAT domain-containing protein n=1 Tax=Paraburkholderia sp. J63 TaxID=2805434 RepID=UPI002ABDAB84|nr:CHAT domain-containing protein [Paraburkholderia sp. J63]
MTAIHPRHSTTVLALAAVLLTGASCTAPTHSARSSPAPTSGNVATTQADGAQGASALSAAAVPEAREKSILQQLAQTEDSEQRFKLLEGLSGDYYRAGRVVDSQRVRERIVDDRHIGAGRRSVAAADLATDYALEDDYSRSDRLLDRARSLASDATPTELETLPREPAYTYLRAAAEIARRHQNRHEEALRDRRELSDLAWHNLNDPALSERRHRAAANELLTNASELVRVLVQNNRRSEALSYANEMLWDIDNRPDMKPLGTQRANVDMARTIALSSNDDYDAAAVAADAAVNDCQHAGTTPFDGVYTSALRQRLLVALARGDIAAYRADADAWEAAAAVNPVVAKDVGANERNSLIDAARGQWAEAITSINAEIANQMRRQGPESPFTKYQQAMRMMYLLEDPSKQLDEAGIAAYVDPIVGSEQEGNDSPTRGAYVEDGALATSMGRLMQDGPQGEALAFRIAELFHMNATQGAMADGAARLAAATPALRALVEQEQALRYQENTAHESLARASVNLESADASGDFNRRNHADMYVERAQKELQKSDDKLAALRKQITVQFPLYGQLAAPVVPSTAALGAVLHEGEVYVDLYAGRDASYAFVVRPGGEFKAVRLATTRAQLKLRIEALRTGFDAGRPPSRAGELAGFDLSAAAALYQALLGPIADDLHGTQTVYLATSGELASIPFDVLITRPATNLADAQWWIETATPVRIPNASALVLARQHPAARASDPLAAFADPSFSGANAQAPQLATAPSAASATTVAARAFPVDNGTREFDYHRVAPLPETLDEAHAIASALGAPKDSVLWGTRATRSAVMKADLSNDRVVLFATHGITPGEVPGWRKSGLALAYEGRGLADSILTADDIVTLRLNADWVVLSACNTGLSTGNAGDAISALSRAFFAAGARSLLVTQWAVESQSAARITTGVFAAYAANSSLSKADALAHAERDMLEGKDGELFRHPYYWGAYELAGDAAR